MGDPDNVLRSTGGCARSTCDMSTAVSTTRTQALGVSPATNTVNVAQLTGMRAMAIRFALRLSPPLIDLNLKR